MIQRLIHRAQRFWRHASSRWTLLAAAGLLLALDAYDLSVFPRDGIDANIVGTLGEWVAGLATAGAVAVAGYGLIAERRRTEADERARDLDAAAELYVWLERPQLRPGRQREALLVTLNRTSVPIYDWSASVEGLPAVKLNQTTLGPILPGERHLDLGSNVAIALDEAPTEVVRVAISFQSTLGVELLRGFDGALSTEKK